MLGVVLAMGFTAFGGRADAGIVIDVSQVGNNVVMTGGGSVDTSSLTGVGDGGLIPAVIPAAGSLALGEPPVGDVGIFAITGPSSFGTGETRTLPGNGTGDVFGVDGPILSGFNTTVLELPLGYQSGSALSASDTYLNTTIAGLGLTPGSYTYTWGTGGTADSLTLNISGVPEPASLTMAVTAAALLGGLPFRRRRRVKG
jgi:MYXO-CTERM domain-containing protein